MKEKNRRRLDIFAVVMFFLIALNIVSVFDNLPGHSIGIACLIAGLYGVISLSKGSGFLF